MFRVTLNPNIYINKDVILSRQKGSSRRHLKNGQHIAGPANACTGLLFWMFGGTNNIANCPLVRMQ